MRGPPRIYWLKGETGCGKSRFAAWRWPDAYLARDSKEGWFDRYNGEKVVLFEDFGGQFPYRDLLRLTDRYKCVLPVKGADVGIHARIFVFTSTRGPEEFYCPDNAEFMRRMRDYGSITDASTEEGAAQLALVPQEWLDANNKEYEE